MRSPPSSVASDRAGHPAQSDVLQRAAAEYREAGSWRRLPTEPALPNWPNASRTSRWGPPRMIGYVVVDRTDGSEVCPDGLQFFVAQPDTRWAAPRSPDRARSISGVNALRQTDERHPSACGSSSNVIRCRELRPSRSRRQRTSTQTVAVWLADEPYRKRDFSSMNRGSASRS
jgi:hypothetical protein